MNTSDEQVRATIAQQAGEWFAMHRAAALDAAERRAFADWILASPVHVEEYLGVALVARDLPAAADDPEMSFESLLDSAHDSSAANVVELGAPQPRATVTRFRPRIPNGVRFAAAAAEKRSTEPSVSSLRSRRTGGGLSGASGRRVTENSSR